MVFGNIFWNLGEKSMRNPWRRELKIFGPRLFLKILQFKKKQKHKNLETIDYLGKLSPRYADILFIQALYVGNFLTRNEYVNILD